MLAFCYMGDPNFLLPCFAVELMYWEIMRLRKEMSMAKLGYYPSDM